MALNTPLRKESFLIPANSMAMGAVTHNEGGGQ